jgi:hypothetical protein
MVAPGKRRRGEDVAAFRSDTRMNDQEYAEFMNYLFAHLSAGPNRAELLCRPLCDGGRSQWAAEHGRSSRYAGSDSRVQGTPPIRV